VVPIVLMYISWRNIVVYWCSEKVTGHRNVATGMSISKPRCYAVNRRSTATSSEAFCSQTEAKVSSTASWSATEMWI